MAGEPRIGVVCVWLAAVADFVGAGGRVILAEAGGAFVDDLVGQHQVVIKSLETNYRRVKGVSGATIMGDGKVALILDTAALVMASQQEMV